MDYDNYQIQKRQSWAYNVGLEVYEFLSLMNDFSK